MKTSAQVDRINFDKLVIKLQKITGISYRKIIDAQAKMILSHAMKNTKVASKPKMVKSFYPINKTLGKNAGGKEWHTDKTDSATFDMTWRLTNARWSDVIKQSKASITKRYAKRGLTKAQFYLMGNAVGLSLKAPKYILKSAQYISANVSGSRVKEGGKFGYAVLMQSSGVRANKSGNANFALNNALKARGNHYLKAIEKGVFKDIAEVRKQFNLG
jgi:hypothetical protein